LELNPDLDGGRDDDEPQQDETGLGSECGCRNEFSGADDGRRDDEPGAQVLEFARECCGWLEHILGIEMVWIDVCCRSGVVPVDVLHGHTRLPCTKRDQFSCGAGAGKRRTLTCPVSSAHASVPLSA